jgi:hypothetical protein
MPIYRTHNAYRGINAHLHSYFQQRGEWAVFHGVHITHLSEALQAVLPAESGYLAVPEKSLQIVRDNLMGQVSRRRTIPDVGIYRPDRGEPLTDRSGAVAPGATVRLMETFFEPETVRSVVIRQVVDDDDPLGVPVTRIELLSPANKPPGSHYAQYLTNRDNTLLSGINLVELDYLHEQRSQLAVLPNYPRREAHAYPYVVAVSVPHPSVEEGRTDFYGFRVDDPLPAVAVPLAGEDEVTLDLNAVYQHTFASNRLFARLVDYGAPPLNFEAYDAEDQRRIQARMEAIAEEPSS